MGGKSGEKTQIAKSKLLFCVEFQVGLKKICIFFVVVVDKDRSLTPKINSDH